MRSLAALFERHLPAGSVALVGAEWLHEALGQRTVVSVAEAAELNGTFATIVSGSASVSLGELADRLEPSGALFLVVPTAHSGLRGAASGLLARARGRAPVELEQLCGALLLAGGADIRAEELGGALGLTAVWARFPPAV